MRCLPLRQGPLTRRNAIVCDAHPRRNTARSTVPSMAKTAQAPPLPIGDLLLTPYVQKGSRNSATLYVFRIRSLTSSPTRSENVILQRQHTRAVAPKTIIRAGPAIRRSRYGENRLGRSIRQRACNWIVPESKSSVCSTELSGVIFSSFRSTVFSC